MDRLLKTLQELRESFFAAYSAVWINLVSGFVSKNRPEAATNSLLLPLVESCALLLRAEVVNADDLLLTAPKIVEVSALQ